ncbi:uncharacterized protein LOC121530510 [Drosophila eugracilis]|uniref:uncharacterized protein LOC121530510 n=1 Tax=Drosophila eugracilis TaxID=29029 RepID=UPI001BDAD5A1|nr:uncharacterized protein LOC121530510 [Drosophila eugracilis]
MPVEGDKKPTPTPKKETKTTLSSPLPSRVKQVPKSASPRPRSSSATPKIRDRPTTGSKTSPRIVVSKPVAKASSESSLVEQPENPSASGTKFLRVTRASRKMSVAEQPTAATAALHKFIAVSDRVSAFEDKINTPGQASQSSHTLQVRLQQVRALWEKVEKEYEICSDLIAQEGSLSTLPLLQAKYDYCYSVYETCAAQISETLDRVTPQADPALPSQPLISSGCRLPPCDTEVFDGDYLRWPTFRDLFTAVYVNNPRLTPVEKLFHLLTKTSGEAKAIVSKSPLTNDGFASAWAALQDRFQNKRLLVNSQLKLLFNLSSISQESGHALKELQSTIQGCLTALAHSNISTDNWDCLLVFLCASKLPKLTLCLWEQSLTSKSEIPAWEEMNTFLSERYRTLEAIEDMKPTQSVPKRLQSFETKVTPKQKGCDLCSKENHPIRLCPRFLNMSVDARSGYIKKKQLCLNCFARGHQLRDCTSTHSCFTCRGRHHTLLHRGSPSSSSTTSSNARPTSSPTSAPSAQQSSSRNASASTSTVQNYFAANTTAVLLSTAIVDARDASGRYVVTLPFCDPENSGSDLGYSRSIALAQFLRNENRLKRDFPLKEQYDSVIQEYLDLGHMHEVPSTHSSPTYYLPHHAVIKPESTTTKLRVVFNASSPSANGTSLNDILHAGPVLQSDLTIQILKWRYFQYVFSADITKMYRQIWVDPKHTPFQRILFRDKEGDIRDFELKTVTFGVNCAPFLAIRVLQQLAEDVQGAFPKASHILQQHMYVDDVLAGANSISEAHSSIQELQAALSSAGFPLRKWTSNHTSILQNIPAEHLLHSEFLDIDTESTAKTLGIRWRAKSDEFYFVPPEIVVEPSFTKREVLSQIARLFDPAGWLAPFIIRSKMFMQEIWLQDFSWDDKLPSEMSQRWQAFLHEYSDLNQIRVPRWVCFQPEIKVAYHGFCDASQKAYGAAIYVRVEVGQKILSNLLTSKTRVAPVKTVSLPRLELCGAVLLAEMVTAILPNMPTTSSDIRCWTDSTIVLAWLRKPACNWTTFVANRVAKITQAVPVDCWAHVRSEQNSADLASRGVSLLELADSQLWWHGPEWLQGPQELWPAQSIVQPNTELEQRAVKVHFSQVPSDEFLERFSKLDKALRVLAYVRRFLSRCRKGAISSTSRPTREEIREAEQTLISIAQRRAYGQELKHLAAKKPLPGASPILNLFPFTDQLGLLRACGRVTASRALQYDERHPIILPYGCRLSRLLVQFTHQITLHGGSQLIVRLIRSKYWIPKLKNLVKAVVNPCKICTIYKKRLQTQLMGDLPKDRVSFSRPFTYTGIDYAGPFEIKNYTGRACLITKGYVCVFVCFSTKAIHLEPTSDLTAEKFLAAFARFVARRGCPRRIHSDNGKTFVGAASLLSRDFLQAVKESVTDVHSHQGLDWRFIPPGAPHMGGLWEAGVKSFKTLFYKATATRKYTFEELATLLAKIEACLNSRPLSPMSEDPSDLLALTPGHFLIGGPLLSTAEPEIKGEAKSIINRWQHLKAQHQQFSARWKEEYLKELHKRNKWQFPTRNIKIDDMVVVKEDNLPSNEWRLGRIVSVFPGADGRVRVAEVRTARGTIKRPVHKVILLPMESKEPATSSH